MLKKIPQKIQLVSKLQITRKNMVIIFLVSTHQFKRKKIKLDTDASK